MTACHHLHPSCRVLRETLMAYHRPHVSQHATTETLMVCRRPPVCCCAMMVVVLSVFCVQSCVPMTLVAAGMTGTKGVGVGCSYPGRHGRHGRHARRSVGPGTNAVDEWGMVDMGHVVVASGCYGDCYGCGWGYGDGGGGADVGDE